MAYAAFLNLIEVLGVLAFAMTGIFEARRLKMDVVGVYSLAMITAFGGGTVRDLCPPALSPVLDPELAVRCGGPHAVHHLRGHHEADQGPQGQNPRSHRDDIRRPRPGPVQRPGLGLLAAGLPEAVFHRRAHGRDHRLLRRDHPRHRRQQGAHCFHASPSSMRPAAWPAAPCTFSSTGCHLPAGVSIPLATAATFVVRMLAVRYNISLPL